MIQLEKHLQTIFHYSSFREGQKESILALLSKQDVLCILPTGGGKSLIYQFVSSLYESGITIVISPLIALMKDQVRHLKAIQMKAEFCYSEQDELEQKMILSKAVTQKIQILFLSPERASSSFFRNLFLKMKVNLLVIDEAHCISKWGHEFRPEYRKLNELREIYPSTFPILALTATATPFVKKDIISSLQFKNSFIYQSSFYKKNLIFKVIYLYSKLEKRKYLLNLLKLNQNKKILIYCSTRKETEEIEKLLSSNSFVVSSYHAGKENKKREKIQDSFVKGEIKILVATNAFGLGVNIPNIQMVIHYNIPESIESYYQEAGRGGRNGDLCECILFCYEPDFGIQKRILSKNKNQELIEYIKRYVTSWECRQVFLCKYFEEETSPCGICDVCRKENFFHFTNYIQTLREKENKIKQKTKELTSEEEKILLNCIKHFSGKFGKKMITSILRGSKSKDMLKKKLDTSVFYGKLSYLNEVSINLKIESLLKENIILIKGKKYPKLSFPSSKKIIKTNKSKDLELEQELFLELKSYRDRTARKYGWKKYMVLNNSVLKTIAMNKPQSLQELLQVKGFGTQKAQKYGSDILQILKKYLY